MDKSQTMNKLDRAGETKTVIDAVNCPDRTEHRGRVGTVCRGCGELIPALVAYEPWQMERYFPGAAIVETPAHSHPYSPEEADVIRRYEIANQVANDLTFELEDARSASSFDGLRVDPRTGDTESLEDARERRRGKHKNLAELEARKEAAIAAAGALLLEHTRLSQVRTNLITQAMWTSSFPPERLAEMARERTLQSRGR